MTLVLVLAALGVLGIVGMLPVEGPAGDGALLVVAALPLAAGAWACWSRRRAPARRR
jgi:hypothetical protein